MSTARGSFEVILADFKKNLTPGELQDFQFVTRNDVRETALRIQKDQENLKTMMNMARLESFLEAMNQFGKVIEVFGNANIFVAFLWGPLKFVLQTASTWADSFESILDAYSQIGEHMPLLEQYQSLFSTKPYMIRVLAFIYADILKFYKKAVRMFRGKTEIWRQLYRSAWKDFGTRFKGLLESLKLHKQLIVEQAKLLHFEESQSNSQAVLAYIQQYEQDRLEKLERLKTQEQIERARKYLTILDWFSAAQSITADHENFHEIRTLYTSGNWILKHEKIQNWREMDTSISSILWVNGIPGAVIIDRCLQDTSRTTGYFYCQRDDPEKNDCILIFRGLLSQFLNNCRELIPYCYKKYLFSGELNLTSLALAEQLLELFLEKIPKQFIIIDGLDECNLAQRKLVLSFLTSMVDRCDKGEPGKLRVLFVSQDFPDIRKSLRAADVMKLTPEDNKNDIVAYVYDWSKKIKEKYYLNDKQVKFIQESTLVRSQGMFFFAKLVIENLYAQETRMYLLREIEVYPFPEGLRDTYERILCRLERSLVPKQWKIVRKLLGWMICAKRPLKWREIQAAVSIDPNKQTVDFDSRSLRSSVREYCGSLIQVLSGDRVELVHITAKMYITESKHVCASAVECNLAALCLRYLTFKCFDDEIDSDYLLFYTTNGFLSFQDYAAAEWLQHIRAIIKGLTTQFFTDHELQDALQELELGLKEFSSRYKRDITQPSIRKEVEEDCESFKAYLFHTNLVYVWNHIYQHDIKGPKARKEISLQSLSKSLLRNRAVLESFSFSTLTEEITTFYGDKHFKCPRPTCFYFHEGFKDTRSREHHINRHDRPFNCAFPDCSIAEFGFSLNKDLEKHKKLFHPETTDQANAFNGKTKATAAATPWVCELCGKRFTREFHQRSHLRSHAGERPFKCGECGRAFTRNNDCKRHEKLHARRIEQHKVESSMSLWDSRADSSAPHKEPEQSQNPRPENYSQIASNVQFSQAADQPTGKNPIGDLEFVADSSTKYERSGQSQHSQTEDYTHSIQFYSYTDEGYVSLANNTSKTQHTEDLNSDSASTIYSDASSLPVSAKESYISELANDLLRIFPSEEPDRQTLERISMILPGLLRTFALKVGQHEPTQMHRDVMVFIHRYRNDIVKYINDKCYHVDESPPGVEAHPSDTMSVDEVMSSWWDRTLGEPGDDFIANKIPFEDGMSDRDSLEDQEDIHYASVGDLLAPDDYDWQGDEQDIKENEDNKSDKGKENSEETTPAQFLAYRNFIFKTPAYEWLRTSLLREFLLVPAEPNYMDFIRQEIVKSLPPSRRVSRKIPADVYSMVFEMEWDPLAFTEDQAYKGEPHEAVEIAITLTGSAKDAQALTCAQYLRQTWPSTGEYIMQLVQDVIRSGSGHRVPPRDLPDKTKLTAWIHKSAVMVEAFGTAGSVAEIGEQLGWIGAALRSSKYDLGVGYCRPLIHFEDTQSLKMGILCKIRFSFQERGKYSEPSKGQCWHNLFKNPVVVEGFPIPRKTEIETGLEIPLHIMAALAQSQRVNTFDGKVFIKGFSTMLVLIKKNADLIIWHLLYNRDGNRISYLDNTVPLGENASVSDVEKARHVLGWCSEVKYYAGAADAAYTIGRSGLNRSQAGALGNVQVFGGHIVAGSFPFGIGQKDIPVRLSRGGYIARLKWMSKKYVVLWDEHEKRGWLVNGTSTLLHLLRASLEYDLTDNFKSVLQFEPGEMQEASALHTAGSAIEVLINPTNMNLAIYPEKTGYIRVEDRIEQFYDILEKIIDRQTIVAGPGGVKLKSTPRRHLEGWDFRDLATNRDPFYPYVAKLQPPAKSWIDLIRTTHAITLFGRGFGEIFRPTGPNPCAHWATLPKEKYYLAASVSDLRDIMAMGGDQNSYPRKLSDDIIWYNPGKLFEPCQCTSEEEGEHSDLAQALLPSKFHKILPKKDLVPLEDRYEGAVIFGHNVNFKWFWKDNGDPEEGEPPTSPVSSPMSPKTQFHDSGISLDSPFAKSSGDLADSSSQQTLNERSFGKQVSDPTISETSKINEIDVQTATTLSLQSATLTPSHYAVGIVCALHKELLAVRSLFDRRHADLGIASDDTNHYALGVIGQHNVVAACLPSGEYGTNSAADVASHMRRSFSKIKFCLLVGIGGGVPSKENDIRLGDVVVSQPTDTHAGVVQYDLGKALENGIFQGTGCLQRPPRFLMTAISSLRSDPDLSTTPLQPYINEIETRSPKYRHQGQDQDKLFAAEYVHNPAHKICEPCDGPQIRRQPRPCNHPNIHYGLIASGNQVMKNAQIRDRLGQEHNVLCFEMEAAGVVNTLPCLVIRGICDYSDSHKNKLWQEYAAATAAAYAKLLLSAVRNSNDVESVPATLNKTKGKKRATSSSAVAKFPSPKKARGD